MADPKIDLALTMANVDEEKVKGVKKGKSRSLTYSWLEENVLEWHTNMFTTVQCAKVRGITFADCMASLRHEEPHFHSIFH